MTKETFSDRDEYFDPALPTGYKESRQASPAKDKLAEKDIDEGNSEKILPGFEKEDSTKVLRHQNQPQLLKSTIL